MEQIYETNDSFNFENLTLSKPSLVNGGNYFIRFLVNNSPLYIQPPTCKTKQGIVKAGKRFYTDLLFTNENDQFIRWMENLENHCQQFIFKNKDQWFEGELDMHDIENYFTSPIKIYKSGNYYIVRTNMNSALGKPSIKIYDEHENEVDMETINEKTNVMTILEIQGIKCSARSFQIEIEIKQMLTLKPVNLFEKCIIKTKNVISENHNHKEITENETIENVYVEETKEVSEEPKEVSEEHCIQEPMTEEKDLEISKDITLPNEIQEINFNLEELPENESIQIKQRNDVYYEMYREAKKKAKIARDLALSSYLEAKRIKNTYMLDDIKDSDDSDLDLEKDENLSFENM